MKREETRELVLATALAQPHRRGSDDPRMESPLGRFCVSAGLAGDLYGAGVRYREIVLEARQALGLPNAGWRAGTSGYSDGMDEAQAAERVARTRAKEDESNAVLKRIALRLPSAMKNLCVIEIDHNQNDSKMLRAGLVALHALYSAGRKKNA